MRREREERPFVGVDGEGLDVCAACSAPWDDERAVCAECGGRIAKHLYTYLCASGEDGEVISDAYNPKGLTHLECINALLEIPRSSVKFGFMLSYDITKIIESMPDEAKYRLLRPQFRRKLVCKDCKKSWMVAVAHCPFCGGPKDHEYTEPVRWRGRAYDFFNGSFSVRADFDRRTKKWGRSVKVWDVFRFFGTAFVEAIDAWGVASPAQLKRIGDMKKKRGRFAHESVAEIQAYCQEECTLLANMMREVVNGHDEAGWKLRAYYGAGSTGAAMLEKYEVKQYRGPKARELDAALHHAIMCAFFGGRFEHNVIGLIRKPVWSKDIASAYPYALTFLPCLACGTWRHVKGRGVLKQVQGARLALCHFTIGAVSEKKRHAMAWGPLPYRDAEGSIAYPLNFTGWAWKPEITEALRGWPELVTVDEAWIYDTACGHEPFAFVPEVYRRRVAWGKEGKGLVLKLGLNSGYGKTAQSIGESPPFQSWVWAGNTTSTCRAQALAAILAHANPWSLLTIATDGITSLEDVRLPHPRDTATAGLRDPKGKVKEPLGGWETEEVPEGMFYAKPGMYFRLETDIKKLRARGIGRKELYDARGELMAAFAAWTRTDFDFAVRVQSRRFWGAKSTIYARSRCPTCDVTWPGPVNLLCPKCHDVGREFEALRQTGAEGRDVYGTWGARDIEIRFDPHPKRERYVARGEFSRLSVRDVGGAQSAPYRGQKTPEVLEQAEVSEMLGEQPDADADFAAGGIE